MRRLKVLASRTASQTDDILVDSFRGIMTRGFVILGFYAAIPAVPASDAVTGALRQLFLVASIGLVTLIISRLAVGYVKLYSVNVQGILPSTSIVSNLTRACIFVIGALVVLQSLGISITPVLTALGVGGLAVALALQDTLSNLFAGLQIIGSGKVKPGDYVQLDSGEEGYVVDVTWRNTTIRELPNNMVIVPNAKLASTRFRNYYEPDKELAVLVQVGVAYQSDLEQVERVTIEVARETMKSVQGGCPEFNPFIRFHTFADSSINFTVILRGAEYTDQFLIKHEFIKRLQRRYQDEKIEIPFPIRTLYTKP